MASAQEPAAEPSLVLASSSARRAALLAQIGFLPARTASPDIDENPRAREAPRAYTIRMAREKAAAVPCGAGEVLLAGDTSVSIGGKVLPPADSDDVVRACLMRLSGRRHHVFSAVAVRISDEPVRVRCVKSIVTFKRLSAADVQEYLASGEGLGKAGGYAIQGRAGGFVRFLSGSYSAVVGLPLFETRNLLLAAGLTPQPR